MEWTGNLLWLLVAIILVLLNGFFVAAEFALVKVRRTKLTELINENRLGAGTAQWLADRMNRALSACQLGITMASLGLGWVGEPAVAHLLEPIFAWVGITSPVVMHTIAFIIAFTLITAAHLVIGEQAPKIFAIRKPESMILWCAMPLKWFYIITYPLLIALSTSTDALLRTVGIESESEHDSLKHIFKCNNTCDSAILIHDEGEMLSRCLEIPEQLTNLHCLRYISWWANHRVDI